MVGCENSILRHDNFSVNLPMVKEQDIKQQAVAENSSNCYRREEISQRAEDENGEPVEQDHFPGMQLDREISMPADNCKSTEVPAVEGGKCMHPQKRQGFLRVVVNRKFQKNINNTGNRCNHQKENPRRQKGLLLQPNTLVQV